MPQKKKKNRHKQKLIKVWQKMLEAITGLLEPNLTKIL